MKVNNSYSESLFNPISESILVKKGKGKKKSSIIKTAKTPKGNRYRLVPPYWIDIKNYKPTVSTHVDTFRDPKKIPKKL